MKTEQLAVVQGWADTRRSLRRWNAAPASVLAPWALASLAVAVLLLAATWLIATLSTPDPSGAEFPGVTYRGDGRRLRLRAVPQRARARAALAGVRGRLHGRLLAAAGRRGLQRRLAPIHELAGPLAIGFVALATLFSLFTQAYALGGHASTLAADLGDLPASCSCSASSRTRCRSCSRCSSRSPPGRSPAAASAGTSCSPRPSSRRRIAIPILLLAGAVEVWVSPRLLLGSWRSALARRPPLYFLKRTFEEETEWPAASSKSPTATSRPRSSSPRPRCSSTSGPPGAARAASWPRCSRRSPPSATTSGS